MFNSESILAPVLGQEVGTYDGTDSLRSSLSSTSAGLQRASVRVKLLCLATGVRVGITCALARPYGPVA